MRKFFQYSLILFLIFTVSPSIANSSNSLTIESDPQGLQVLRSDTVFGRTPRTLSLESTEGVQVGLRNQDIEWSSTLKLRGDGVLRVSLKEDAVDTPYNVLVVSRPQGATVRINGEKRGQTPWSGTLESDKTEIRLTEEGFEPWEIEFTPGTDFVLNGSLKRQSATEEVETIQEGRSGKSRLRNVWKKEYVDDSSGSENVVQMTSSNRNNKQFKRVLSGETTSKKSGSLVKRMDGMKKNTSTFKGITKERRLSEEYDFAQPDEVPVEIRTVPSRATVKVDGKKLGKTPIKSKQLPSERSRITIEKQGYEIWEDKFLLKSPLRLKVTLKVR